jgi:hypothetical protein
VVVVDGTTGTPPDVEVAPGPVAVVDVASLKVTWAVL